MLINQDGTIDNSVNAVLLANSTTLQLGDGQFFQITDTGKRLELWETFKDGRVLRVKYWNRKSVVAFYGLN